MCGICGIFHMGDRRPVAAGRISRMADTLIHRGPDEGGIHVEDGLGLGFRRLSIVDLAGGSQPITNEDGNLVLVCNGEIYNHGELRADLIARGHRFRSGSDVEVLLHLYEDLGEAMVERLEGQFAFALFDRARRRLVLGRDPFGVAPLFYAQIDGGLVFASEIKAILTHPAMERRVDPAGLDQVLGLPGLVSPRTLFQGVSSLPAGFCLTADTLGVRLRRYWDMDYPPDGPAQFDGSDEAWREALDTALRHAVRRRLQGEVPVGAYLSGGLDSSLVVALMREIGGAPVRTFSIAFGDHRLDERRFQREVAARLDCRHTEIELDPAGIGALMRDVVWQCECPVRETYNAASLALSAAARRAGVPVVLSGEGADELFAGYVGYKYDAFGPRRSPASERESVLRERLWGDATVFYEHDLAGQEGHRLALYAPALRERFRDFAIGVDALVPGERLRGRHVLHQRSYLDLKLRLADHLVGDHGDRMLLANAVEGRFPFLDLDVAELARLMPPDLKLRNYQEKFIVKQVARPYLPASIVEREKFAFSAPGGAALLHLGEEWVEDLLSPATLERQGYFDPAAVAALRRRCVSAGSGGATGQPVHALAGTSEADLLMAVLTFGMFLEVFDMPNLGG
ncbi:MAG: asparagine synthase (glutamine-hydrolyzing) [Azospirillaceae bacterium]|nr:asparagine synthase (glutamine-hydrolyzing) [Azospirillaceae bacterium]